MTKAVEKRLIGTWRHSHEEDTDAGTVYRTDVYAFPPSRGRQGFSFREDHSGTALGISPRDGTATKPFKWEVSGDKKAPVVRLTHADGRREEIKVLSIDGDRMVLAKR